MKPLAIDLYAGLGGWTEGLLAAGYDVVGFDIERHVYGEHRYPAQLVLQDVRTLHGRQFKDAALIVASPPCQEFSYPALMPMTKSAAKVAGLNWSGSDKPGYVARAFNDTAVARLRDHVKNCGDWFNAKQPSKQRMCGSKSKARRHAQAMIAKIPLPLSQYIAQVFKPEPRAGP